MAKRGRFSAQKRRREAIKRQKKQEKMERREKRKEDDVEGDDMDPEEDPDIAGIVPGPQAPIYDVGDPEDL